MSGVRLIEIAEDDAGMRLDRWLKQRLPGLSHGQLEKLLRTGQVRVDRGRVKGGFRLAQGHQVRIPPLPEEAQQAVARKLRRQQPDAAALAKLTAQLQEAVIFKDDTLLALNKPAGLAVQGGSQTEEHIDLALDGLRFDTDARPRLVHRLDKETSGVLLLARSAPAARRLSAAFRDRQTQKAYWALVHGVPAPARGRIDLPLSKQRHGKAERMAADPQGKPARTFYEVQASIGNYLSWVALFPESGRTHQLRVHCAAIGHPILGDRKYGERRMPAALDGLSLPDALYLHARAVRLQRASKAPLKIEAALPAHFLKAFNQLNLSASDQPDAFAAMA